MKMLTLFGILMSFNLARADHQIADLQGEWYSSIFPTTVRYKFFGLQAEGTDFYIVRHVRTTATGECLGVGSINLHTGTVRTVETCPPRKGGTREEVFNSIWSLVNEHGELHLKGGYYSEGSSTYRPENLDKDDHGSGHGGHPVQGSKE